MALSPSQRPTREWPLLVLALALVGAVCFPLWQGLAGDAGAGMFSGWDAARWGKLLFGPEQVVCYCCFTWACLILFSRYWEIRRQRRAFGLELLPTEEGTRILYEDARPLQRRVEQVLKERGPFILVNMVRMALAKFIVSRASKDVSETVRIQAEVDQGRLASGLSTVNYLVWAIPAIGFLGTVRGLAGSLTMSAADNNLTDAQFLDGATGYLNVAFDTTFVALLLSLGVMFLVHSVQREEENLVTDCQQYCTEHLVNRLYEPETFDEEANAGDVFSQDFTAPPTGFASHGSRLSS